MPIKHACFISYCHGQGSVMRPFVEQLATALGDYLEPYLDQKVYVDSDRLKPGYRFNEALAEAICESLCMIVIYVPKYERHPYCGREFAAMELLESGRFQRMGQAVDRKRGMIIPIILRGASAVPERITAERHYADFSKYSTATTNFLTNPEYVSMIQKIVEVIYELYQAVEAAGVDICSDCREFQLPGEAPTWRPKGTLPTAPLPGCEATQ